MLKLTMTNIIVSLIKVEPYWNVNTVLTFSINCSVAIKVEPYWNVNGVAIIPPAIDTGN